MLRRTAFLLVLALLVAPTFAVADSIVFHAGGAGGEWSWPCTGLCIDPLTAIFNDVEVAFGGGLFTDLVGSVLTVTTGNWTGAGSGTLDPFDPFTFEPGGSITITGCGGGGAELCFSGEFINASILFDGAGTTGILVGDFIAGTVHQDILNMFNLGTNGSVEGSISLVLQGDVLACLVGSCHGLTASGDIAVTPIPEPASLALLGTGLLGLASRFRKKLSA